MSDQSQVQQGRLLINYYDFKRLYLPIKQNFKLTPTAADILYFFMTCLKGHKGNFVDLLEIRDAESREDYRRAVGLKSEGNLSRYFLELSSKGVMSSKKSANDKAIRFFGPDLIEFMTSWLQPVQADVDLPSACTGCPPQPVQAESSLDRRTNKESNHKSSHTTHARACINDLESKGYDVKLDPKEIEYLRKWAKHDFSLKGADGYFHDVYLVLKGPNTQRCDPMIPGWRRVLSFKNRTIQFHIPDSFDLGDLPWIDSNYDTIEALAELEQAWSSLGDVKKDKEKLPHEILAQKLLDKLSVLGVSGVPILMGQTMGLINQNLGWSWDTIESRLDELSLFVAAREEVSPGDCSQRVWQWAKNWKAVEQKPSHYVGKQYAAKKESNYQKAPIVNAAVPVWECTAEILEEWIDIADRYHKEFFGGEFDARTEGESWFKIISEKEFKNFGLTKEQFFQAHFPKRA